MSDKAAIDGGTSEFENALTPEDAAEKLAGLFSDEDTDSSEPQKPSRKAKAPQPDDEDDESDVEENEDEGIDANDEGESEEDGEDAAADSDDESDEDDEEQDDSDDETPKQTFTVKVDGKEEKVTLDELLKGYSRTQDYTRKTMANSEERKAIQAERQKLRAEREEAALKLSQLHEVLDKFTAPDEPDWAALAKDDPATYTELREAWDERNARLKKLAEERDSALRQMQADQQEALKEYVQQEREKLLTALPDWSDAEVAKAEKTALVDYAKAQGFSDNDLAQVYDHRVLVMLRKAMLFDRHAAEQAKLRKKASDKIKKAVRTATPGAPATRSTRKSQKVQDSLKRLKRTGDMQDGVAALMLIDD